MRNIWWRRVQSRVHSELHNVKSQTSVPAKNMNEHYQCYTDTADDSVTHCQLLERIYSPLQADCCLSLSLSLPLLHSAFHSLCESDGNCLNKEGPNRLAFLSASSMRFRGFNEYAVLNTALLSLSRLNWYVREVKQAVFTKT